MVQLELKKNYHCKNILFYKLEGFLGISTTKKNHISTQIFFVCLRWPISNRSN